VSATYKIGGAAVNETFFVRKSGDNYRLNETTRDLSVGSARNKTLPMLVNGVKVTVEDTTRWRLEEDPWDNLEPRLDYQNPAVAQAYVTARITGTVEGTQNGRRGRFKTLTSTEFFTVRQPAVGPGHGLVQRLRGRGPGAVGPAR